MHYTAPRFQQVWRELDDSVPDRSSPLPPEAPTHCACHLQGAAAVCCISDGMLLSNGLRIMVSRMAGERGLDDVKCVV